MLIGFCLKAFFKILPWVRWCQGSHREQETGQVAASASLWVWSNMSSFHISSDSDFMYSMLLWPARLARFTKLLCFVCLFFYVGVDIFACWRSNMILYIWSYAPLVGVRCCTRIYSHPRTWDILVKLVKVRALLNATFELFYFLPVVTLSQDAGHVHYPQWCDCSVILDRGLLCTVCSGCRHSRGLSLTWLCSNLWDSIVQMLLSKTRRFSSKTELAALILQCNFATTRLWAVNCSAGPLCVNFYDYIHHSNT